MALKPGLRIAAGILVALVALLPFSMASAEMTCDPVAEFVCFGDSGEDPYAFCDGEWYDVYVIAAEAQVCNGYDGVLHIFICPWAISEECEDIQPAP